MRLLETLASAFINTFGITQPDDRTRRRATRFIVGLLALVIVALCLLGVMLFHLIRG